MTPTNEYFLSVQEIVNLVRLSNSKIGTYQQHFYNENFQIVVRLSNGRLRMSVEMAQDYERGSQFITQAQIQAVANSFQES